MSKTKAELELEIKHLKAQLSEVDKVEQYNKSATEMMAVYQSFIKAGFTEEQAWEMLSSLVKGAAKPKTSIF